MFVFIYCLTLRLKIQCCIKDDSFKNKELKYNIENYMLFWGYYEDHTKGFRPILRFDRAPKYLAVWNIRNKNRKGWMIKENI